MGLRIKKKATTPCDFIELVIDGETITVGPRALRQSEREAYLVSAFGWQRELKAWRASLTDGEGEVGALPVQPSRSVLEDVIVEVTGLEDEDGKPVEWKSVSPEDRAVFVEMLSDTHITKIMSVANSGGALPAGGKDD